VKHLASSSFWETFENLPAHIQKLAKKNISLLKQNSEHPSLHFKKVGRYRSVRVGMHYRALGVEIPEGVLWFWIGTHADYDKLIK